MRRSMIPLLGGIAATLAVTVSAAPPAPTPDQVRGKQLFLRCMACHAVTPTNKVGPHLQGVVGRKSGAVPGFRYSAPMQKANLVWTETQLDAWLTRPTAVVPGTSMAFAGVPDAKDRKAIIAYLKKPVP